jgi:spore maturation protein CgeB
MRVVMFCHSLVSDWNHGNAHFLRGISSELLSRGHEIRVFEPRHAWSMTNLLADAGPDALRGFHAAYPELSSTVYAEDHLDLDQALEGADVVIVHEWNEPALVERIGRHHAAGGRYVLLFHDTHHRSATDAGAMSRYVLDAYDGVLAFGDVIRERYVRAGWARRAWTWHEAADTRVFQPRPGTGHASTGDGGDLVWIGNWGDEERSTQIRDYLIDPVADLGIRARVHGVRYPSEALQALEAAGIVYGGWLPNYRVPDVFGGFRATVHIPRQPYVDALPGVPTIRVFEALACGIPLVSCYWNDCEQLFRPDDFLMVDNPAAMRRALRRVLQEPDAAAAQAARGRETILGRHTCSHRVSELMAIVGTIAGQPEPEPVGV